MKTQSQAKLALAGVRGNGWSVTHTLYTVRFNCQRLASARHDIENLRPKRTASLQICCRACAHGLGFKQPGAVCRPMRLRVCRAPRPLLLSSTWIYLEQPLSEAKVAFLPVQANKTPDPVVLVATKGKSAQRLCTPPKYTNLTVEACFDGYSSCAKRSVSITIFCACSLSTTGHLQSVKASHTKFVQAPTDKVKFAGSHNHSLQFCSVNRQDCCIATLLPTAMFS